MRPKTFQSHPYRAIRWFGLTALFLLVTVPGATIKASAASKIDPSAYPELSLDHLLPLIVADIKANLPDPYSIKDLTVCSAGMIHLRDGKPYKWSVQLAMNAKGPNGAYTGFSPYTIGFKQGTVDLHIFSPGLSREGLDGLIRRSVMKQFASCTTIPDATVQSLLVRPIGSGD